MRLRRIWELPVKKFDGDMIDNCFYVKDLYAPEYYVKMSEIFDWIKEKAETTGLTVELKDNNIMFISGSCLSREEDEYHKKNSISNVSGVGIMPWLICHYNEREGGYLTVGKIYQAVSINEDGWIIKDDSGGYNIYSSAYLNKV